MNLNSYDVSQATHLLKCRHQIGRNGHDYVMSCIIIGITKSRMRRIVVFGERGWVGRNHKKRVRYVAPWRLIEIKESSP